MKRILYVSYHFAPDAAVGAQRADKFAKYLPGFGWEPIVLTVREKFYDELDDSVQDCPRLTTLIVRTGMFKSAKHYCRMLTHSWRRRNANPVPVSGLSLERKCSNRVTNRQIISSLLAFPDGVVGWLPFALIKGMSLIRRHSIALILTSGPPHSVHLIGALLRRLAKIPWIADFRDPYIPWIADFRDPYLEDPPLYFDESVRAKLELAGDPVRRWAAALGDWFVSEANHVLTTTEQCADYLRGMYPSKGACISTIANGYDSEEFSRIRPEKERQFTICYFGSLYVYQQRDPEMVLQVLAELIRVGEVGQEVLRVRFVGVNDDRVRGKLKSVVEKYGLVGNVEILWRVPRHKALEMMVRSHVLLALAERQPLCIPAKVYEYLGAGSTIVAIAGEGATARFLRDTGTGVVIEPNDKDSMKKAVKMCYEKYVEGTGEATHARSVCDAPPYGKGYRCRELTEQLAKLLEGVATRS